MRLAGMMGNIDLLLNGSIDLHLHHGPDTEPRRIDALEAAKQAQQAGMRAIVFKPSGYRPWPVQESAASGGHEVVYRHDAAKRPQRARDRNHG